jgi:predicted ester cyclase
MTGITIYRLIDAKISEAWSNLDQLEVLGQLGMIPGPTGPG